MANIRSGSSGTPGGRKKRLGIVVRLLDSKLSLPLATASMPRMIM